MKEDYTLTEAARAAGTFVDGRSYITKDGREILFGEDLRRRRWEVWKLDGGKCRKCHAAVSLERMHMHHVRHRGSNGVDRDDRLENLQTECSLCHSKEHVRVQFRGSRHAE